MKIEKAFFVSDLHGRKTRYDSLFNSIFSERPELVLIGGDLLPSGISILTNDDINGDFFDDYLKNKLISLKSKMKETFPLICVIAGNDDPAIYEEKFIELENSGLWKYVNQKIINFNGFNIIGYCFVPPTPFLLKDWEKYDVSRFIDVGCVSPEEGFHSVKVEPNIIRYSTISEDLNLLTKGVGFNSTIFLFHSPPYNSNLDKINTKNKMIDFVQPDENVGSIAIRKFIEKNQPLLTLHGHIHESTSLTGEWKIKIGNTICMNASTNSAELSVIKFSINGTDIEATRKLI